MNLQLGRMPRMQVYLPADLCRRRYLADLA
jgi:hypothetical protein